VPPPAPARKLFVGFSGTEFWTLQGSPLLTDAFGTTDLVQPADARIYYYASSHHIIGQPSLAGSLVGATYPTNGNLGVVPVVRALYQALEDWVVAGTTPPDSQVPKIADSTLVRPNRVSFPSIPASATPASSRRFRCSTGARSTRHRTRPASRRRCRRPTWQGLRDPGSAGRCRRQRCRRHPQHRRRRSTATNTGWNFSNKPGVIDQGGLFGSIFPYKKTQAERVTAGDPRPSLTERYGTQAGYVTAVTTAANDLVARRFLLRADADAAIAAAVANPVLP
jgi:hypothetical protein